MTASLVGQMSDAFLSLVADSFALRYFEARTIIVRQPVFRNTSGLEQGMRH